MALEVDRRTEEQTRRLVLETKNAWHRDGCLPSAPTPASPFFGEPAGFRRVLTSARLQAHVVHSNARLA